MGSGQDLDWNEIPIDDLHAPYVMLEKDKIHICRARYTYLPFEPPTTWSILDFIPKDEYVKLNIPRCQLHPEPHEVHQLQEWGVFTHWLLKNKKVAIVKSESHEFYILPPKKWEVLSHVEVLYRVKNKYLVPKYPEMGTPGHAPVVLKLSSTDVNSFPCEYVGGSASVSHPFASMDDCGQKKIVKTGPSYLETLGLAHAWAFGAIAELVDNSRNAGATTLDIHVESLHLKKRGRKVPVLSIIDDGHGMSHNEIIKMLSLGHRQSDDKDPGRMGRWRFGIGFKTGSMKLGRDVIVLTQTSSSRSVALLSQTLNEDNDILVIPTITYSRDGDYMEVDLNIQSETVASNYLKMIKDFSPFNEYSIGGKFRLYSKMTTVTQIYIWNLDEWRSDYTLEWYAANTVDSASRLSSGDILIHPCRVKSRIGQTIRKVPLDYSLKAYLEVIFIDPCMTIYVQSSLVKCRSLAKTLSQTMVMEGKVMSKHVQLTLGWSREEWERANCGIFLYWHGRLIEAYKRVGGMVHSADMGRGVIGVVDVSDIMDDENGEVWVLNNKQGFRDCEAYAKLLDWLGNKADEYWDKNFDIFYLGNGKKVPGHGHVRCNKCRKRRILNTDFDIKTLPQEWFCYMPPFYGNCKIPEQEVEHRVNTASAKRSRTDVQEVDNRTTRRYGRNKRQKLVRFGRQLSRNNTATKHEKGNRWYSRPSNHNNNVGGYNRWESWDSRTKNVAKLSTKLPKVTKKATKNPIKIPCINPESI